MWNSPYCQLYNPYNGSSKNLVFDQIIPNWYFSLFSALIWLILYWYCKEKFCFGHSVRGLKACDTAVFKRGLKNQSHLAFPTTTHNQSLYDHGSMRTHTAWRAGKCEWPRLVERFVQVFWTNHREKLSLVNVILDCFGYSLKTNFVRMTKQEWHLFSFFHVINWMN